MVVAGNQEAQLGWWGCCLCFHLLAYGMLMQRKVLVEEARLWAPGVPACISM